VTKDQNLAYDPQQRNRDRDRIFEKKKRPKKLIPQSADQARLISEALPEEATDEGWENEDRSRVDQGAQVRAAELRCRNYTDNTKAWPLGVYGVEEKYKESFCFRPTLGEASDSGLRNRPLEGKKQKESISLLMINVKTYMSTCRGRLRWIGRGFIVSSSSAFRGSRGNFLVGPEISSRRLKYLRPTSSVGIRVRGRDWK